MILPSPTHSNYTNLLTDIERGQVICAMRHCLYAGDPEVFASLLTDRARESFDGWRAEHKPVVDAG